MFFLYEYLFSLKILCIFMSDTNGLNKNDTLKLWNKIVLFMEAKQIKTQKNNNSSCVKKTPRTMNMVDNRINPQVQLIASMQSVQRTANNPILQFVKLSCRAEVESDKFSANADTTNVDTSTHWAERRIKNSPFSTNFKDVTNQYPNQQFRIPYSCAEPKALAEAISRMGSSIRFINQATIYPAIVKEKDPWDSPNIKVGNVFTRCLNCRQWAGKGKNIVNIKVLPKK